MVFYLLELISCAGSFTTGVTTAGDGDGTSIGSGSVVVSALLGKGIVDDGSVCKTGISVPSL